MLVSIAISIIVLGSTDHQFFTTKKAKLQIEIGDTVAILGDDSNPNAPTTLIV